MPLNFKNSLIVIHREGRIRSVKLLFLIYKFRKVQKRKLTKKPHKSVGRLVKRGIQNAGKPPKTKPNDKLPKYIKRRTSKQKQRHLEANEESPWTSSQEARQILCPSFPSPHFSSRRKRKNCHSSRGSISPLQKATGSRTRSPDK